MKIAITGTGGTGTIGHVLHKLKSIGIHKEMIIYDKTIPLKDVKEIEVQELDSMFKQSDPLTQLKKLEAIAEKNNELYEMQYENCCHEKLKSWNPKTGKPRKRKTKGTGGLGNPPAPKKIKNGGGCNAHG